MTTAVKPHIAVCLALTSAVRGSHTVEDIYAAALDALAEGVGLARASIHLFDSDEVMRFKASRGLSDGYRAAVEGHTPWTPDFADPQPIVVANVVNEPSLRPFLPIIEAEEIGAMVFIPLVSLDRVIGTLTLYYAEPHEMPADTLQLVGVIAAQVACAVERTRAEEEARVSEERLRFALDAAAMGTWEWDLTTQAVKWSENLERIHGLPEGTFTGTFASYEREIHPDDRERVFASLRRALEEGVPHDVEYRIAAPDGTVRWVEGKGRVECAAGRPARMSGVCMMVTRRKEAELARLAAAEDASRLKDEFLATLSHELRTPLNAVLGWIQILQGDLPPEQVRHAIEVIGRNARLQAQLIDDMLDVSRIITGKLELERVPVVVSDLIATAVHAMLPSASVRQIAVTQAVEAGLPLIDGDPKRLQQVLGNVLSNAIKFTPESGTVHIACRVGPETIVIEIQDSGIGIPREFLPLVFERFRQADSRTTRRHSGLGLGLAIARHLVELHHGEIEAHSEGPGHGTTVTIRLPAAGSCVVGDVPARPLSASNVRLEGTIVLVVDDQPDSRELLAAVLGACGASVVQSGSAAEALARLNGARVDLLVADIAMPDVDGYELIERVRGSRPYLPAVAVSAYARRQDRSRARAAGYSAYCTKPLDVSDFLQTVRSVLVGGAD